MSDPDGPWHDRGAHLRDEPTRRSLPEVVGELVWRYRTAPLATRVTVDLVVVAIALVLVVGGVFLLLRDPGGPDLASASAGRSTTGFTAPSTTQRPTTTAAPTTTTTAPPTTTTEPPPTTEPPTTMTAPPPTTAAPAPPPPAPPTTEAPYHRSCAEAAMAGALPLHRGEPGYGEHLDGDRDGEACERRDW